MKLFQLRQIRDFDGAGGRRQQRSQTSWFPLKAAVCISDGQQGLLVLWMFPLPDVAGTHVPDDEGQSHFTFYHHVQFIKMLGNAGIHSEVPVLLMF